MERGVVSKAGGVISKIVEKIK